MRIKTEWYARKETIFWLNFYCPFMWRDPYECLLKKPPSLWLKFFDSHPKTSCLVGFLKLTLATYRRALCKIAWKPGRKWFPCSCTILFEVTSAFVKMRWLTQMFCQDGYDPLLEVLFCSPLLQAMYLSKSSLHTIKAHVIVKKIFYENAWFQTGPAIFNSRSR